MRKIIWGGITAISTVLFMGLKTIKNTGPYYFMVNPGVNKTFGSSFSDDQVTFIFTPFSASCYGDGVDCVVTFATSALTVGHQHLNLGFQQARSTIYTRYATY